MLSLPRTSPPRPFFGTPRLRAAAIALGVSLLCYVGDFMTFERSDYGRYAALYLLIGITTFFTVSLAYRVVGARGPMPVRRELLAAVLGILPGICLPHLVEARLWSSSFNFGDYWAYCVYGVVIAAAVSLYFAHRQSLEDLVELRARTSEAQYDLLKNRMQPHFLFNALNSLAELIAEDPRRAETMAQELSDLYRAILRNAERRTAPLESELAIARNYLAIEALRFGERLRFEILVSPEVPLSGASSVHLPSLVAQTLVENAVKHGISNSLEGGKVVLEIRRAAPYGYRFLLRNTGAPFRAEARPGNGLSNTRHRLTLLYGSHHRFTAGTAPDGATEVTFLFSGEPLG